MVAPRLVLTLALALVLCGSGVAAARLRPAPQIVRAYAQTQAAKHGWSGAEWVALDTMIGAPGGESGWNPCAVYPGRSDCGYSGSNSCGVPQATPCPPLWRGRLDRTWKAQVAWTITYVLRRYGSPSAALAYHRLHGSY